MNIHTREPTLPVFYWDILIWTTVGHIDGQVQWLTDLLGSSSFWTSPREVKYVNGYNMCCIPADFTTWVLPSQEPHIWKNKSPLLWVTITQPHNIKRIRIKPICNIIHVSEVLFPKACTDIWTKGSHVDFDYVRTLSIVQQHDEAFVRIMSI